MTYIYNIEWIQCWADKKAYLKKLWKVARRPC